MQRHNPIPPYGSSTNFQEEVSDLANRYGVSQETARTILSEYAGERDAIEQAAARLGRYERFFARLTAPEIPPAAETGNG